MTLATHMVTGAAASRLFATHPAQAFLIGWLSHYIFDTITHWDYPIHSYASHKHAPGETKVTFNKIIFLDIGKVLLDVSLGVLFIFTVHGRIMPGHVSILIAGALGATVPDFLQFVYGLTKFRVLGWLQRFHHFMHSGKSLNDRPVVGIVSQICLIIVAGFFLYMTL